MDHTCIPLHRNTQLFAMKEVLVMMSKNKTINQNHNVR